MKYLSDTKISEKKVLLRCDFNVPVKDGKIIDDSKIVKSLDTINYLLNNENTVIILSHFGRVKSEDDKKNNSLKVVYEELKKYIDLEFIQNPLDLSVIKSSSKKCFLVENTRFTDVPEKKESANDLELAKYWASFADIFVIDAFASLHRAHTSTSGLSNYLPTYLGFLIERELTNLESLINIQERPFLVIMGGAKVDDKIGIMKSLLQKCDKLVITGGILNTFLKVKGHNIGNSLVSNDEAVLNDVKEILSNYQDKILYSDKFVVARGNGVKEVKLEEIEDTDIIYDNIVDLPNLINDYKLVFLNGTCGKYEDNVFAKGTKNLFEHLKKSHTKVYIGGGDSASAVINLKYDQDFEYISSGGGATLEYVAYGKLKALEYIKNIQKD